MATDTDMDIEMDIDVGMMEDDHLLVNNDIELLPEQKEPQSNELAPNDTSEPDSDKPAPNKVHIRGLDNLTTKDIKAFASEYYSAGDLERIEWIDDTSANLVYASPEVAQEALISFSSVELADVSQLPILQTIPAKPFPLYPQTNLEVRLAVLGDRKQAGARERSRFYLFNPEHDPAERRKRGGPGRRAGDKYRDRDNGSYRSQRYDENEQRRRQDADEEDGFDASLYDDDDVALAARAARDPISSGSDLRSQRSHRVRFRGTAGKELFPDLTVRRDGGRLSRDRSASPTRDRDRDRDRRRGSAASENRAKAHMMKTQLREAGRYQKELFPHKTGVSHHRSDAFDAADETADLFANKMSVPFLDGSGDGRPKRETTLASRITQNNLANRITRGIHEPEGFNIRGSATIPKPQGFSIKGIASSESGIKELFPSHLGGNAGKELFSERLEGRGIRRQKAEDLFID